MTSSVSPSIDHLATTWSSVIGVCTGLSDEEWARPTGCPGWSVQDNVAHLIDYESRALGRPAPPGDPLTRPHTRNALGESNEIGVEYRRSRSGPEVLEELREVTEARLAQLRTFSAEDLRREIVTPAGPGTVADMLTLRVMDTWSHEQDIRRALRRPGHERGPAVDETVAYFGRFLPIVVGRRAGAPDGATVVLAIGDGARFAFQMAGGRAQVLDEPPADPTVRLAMPATTFAALVGGRTDAPDDVAIEGDQELGRKIVGALGFMP